MLSIIKKVIILFIPVELIDHARFEFKSKLGCLLSKKLKIKKRYKLYQFGLRQ